MFRQNTRLEQQPIGGQMIRRGPRPRSNFTIVRNDIGLDHRLSYRARGVLLAILVRPDNWTASAESLSRQGSEGRDAILRSLSELESFGYLVRTKRRGDDGRFIHESVVYDFPQVAPVPEKPESDNQGLVAQSRDLRPPYKNDLVRTDSKEQTSVDLVFTAWLEATGKDPSRTKLDKRRAERIRWALENYPLEDVLDAVRGWRKSSFHVGENERGRPYCELTLLLRDAQHLEEFRDLNRGSGPAPRTSKAWNKLRSMMEEEQ